MTFDEFLILVKGMKAVYTSDKFLPDADSVKIWFKMLEDLDYNSANAGIQKYMMTAKFPPTIADIREHAASVRHGDLPDWGKGWEQVLDAVRKYGSYNVDGAMNSFDPITRKCVERLGFREICMSENIAVDRANFRMIFEQLATRKQKDQQIAISLQKAIKQIQIQQKEQSLQLEGGSHNEC